MCFFGIATNKQTTITTFDLEVVRKFNQKKSNKIFSIRKYCTLSLIVS